MHRLSRSGRSKDKDNEKQKPKITLTKDKVAVAAVIKSKSTTSGQNKDIEVILLSDSEEHADLPQPASAGYSHYTRNRNVAPQPQLQPQRQRQNAAAPTPVPAPDVPKTPPPIDIESYYKSQGVSLSHVRRLNRNFLRNDGVLPGGSEEKGVVYLDSYIPPPAFKDVELPPLESSQGKTKEEAVSPAIINAQRYKLKPEKYLRPEPTEEDYQELLGRLTTMTKRKAADENKENLLENPSKKSTPENPNKVSSPQCPETTTTSSSSFNITFPDDESDLNDSLLLRCTQAAELAFEHEQNNNQSKPILKHQNLNTSIASSPSPPVLSWSRTTTLSRNRNFGPNSTSTPINTINSSKCKAGASSSSISTTPKIDHGIGVGPARRSRNQVDTPTPSSELSIGSMSSSSVVENSTSLRRSMRNAESVPAKKSLFSEKENGNILQGNELELEVGEIKGIWAGEEDNDDDIRFSQINMDLPSKNANADQPKQKTERNVCNETTLLISETTGDNSFFSKSGLAELDRLEAMALNSGSGQSKQKKAPTLQQELQRSKSKSKDVHLTGRLRRVE